jgi:hypothetical protein
MRATARTVPGRPEALLKTAASRRSHIQLDMRASR